MLSNRIAQTLNEYAIVIVLMTMGFIAIQMYFKRGIQTAIKRTADDFGNVSESVYGIEAQTLGVMEQGLAEYKVENPGIITGFQKKTNLVEAPQSEPNPMRTYNTEYEKSVVGGTWKVVYKAGNTESFGAKEKTTKKYSNPAINNAAN